MPRERSAKPRPARKEKRRRQTPALPPIEATPEQLAQAVLSGAGTDKGKRRKGLLGRLRPA